MNTFWIVAFAIGQSIPQTQSFFQNENNVISCFSLIRWLQAYGIGAESPFLYPFWFLRNLLIFNLFANVIKKILDFAPRISIAVICFIFLFIEDFPFNNFAYLLYPFDLCMWYLGYFFARNKWDARKIEKRKKIVLMFFIVVCVFRILMKDVDISWVAPYRICMVVALLFWYCFTMNINGKIQHFLLRISPFNFGIYVFHEMNMTFCKKLISRLWGNSMLVLILEYFLLPIVIVFLVIDLCCILKKVVPKTYSVLMGSRN